jgi:transposase
MYKKQDMDTDELRQFIVQKRELLARETFSRRAFNRCENMSDEMKNRYVEYLIERLENAELDNRAMKLVLEDLTKELSRSNRMLEKLNELQSLLEEERESRKSLERENIKLKEQLKSARKNRFGSKRQSVKKGDSGSDDDPVDREKEKDGFDGTDESLDTRSVAESETQESRPSSPNPGDLSNRPDTYRTMGVNGTPVRHLSDLSKVPGRILDRKLVKTFRLDICLVEEQFEMVQYVEKGRKPRWGYFPKEGHLQVVTRFDGTKITPGFLQAIAYEVYVKNVTFGLLHQWLGDMGMSVSENTLRNWLKKGRKYLDRMVLELKRIALEKDAVVNCDETWCKVRKYDRYKKCYMWVLVNKAERVVIFFYEDGSRGRDVLTNFLGDAGLKALMSDGYNAYVFIGDELKTHRYKDTDHQVCLAHVRAKFVKARMEGGDKRADVFLDNINRLFRFEREYDREMITDEERTRRRQGLPTLEAMINLRANLLQELKSEGEHTSCYMREALNYLHKFWKEAFTYIKDGRYPISNNLAERAVRPFTTKRKNSLHFGSDEGAEIAAVYHSIISTVKLQGRSTWDYLGKFFTGIFNGCRDFLSLAPQNIDLAVCQ